MIKKKKILSGSHLEIEYYRCHPSGRKIRQPKQNTSSEAQAALNLRNAKKWAVRMANTNFVKDDIFFTGCYKKGQEPDSYEEVQADVSRFIRKLRKEYQKRSLEMKYMYSIERKSRKKVHDHWHVHIFLNKMDFDGDRDLVEKMWEPGKFNNSKRLQPDANGLRDIASYICKEQAGGKNRRRFVCSRNLKKPVIEVVNSGLSESGLARIATTQADDAAYWERQYKSFNFVAGNAWYCEELSCWQLAVHMAKKQNKGRPKIKTKEGESYDTKKKKEKMPDMQQRRDNL